MSIADRILARFEHYANAVFVRIYILRELLRARRRGNKINTRMLKESFTRPRWQEDFVLLLRFFDSSETVTLIDVGANDGAWSKKFLDIYPNAFVLAIEPIPSNYQRLLAAHRGDVRVVALNSAVSEQTGTLELFLNEADTSGVGATAHRYDKKITDYSSTVNSHYVEAVTLNQLFETYRDRIKGKVIVKIDVQGHEPSVLKGAAAVLDRVDAMHIEVSLFQYEGQEHGLSEIVPLLSAAGLHLGPYQQCIGRTLSRYPFELDMVFVRKDSLPRLLGY